MTTIITDTGSYYTGSARIVAQDSGDQLWLTTYELQRIIGWQLKPQGFCRGQICVPVPDNTTLVDGSRVDVAGLWQHLGWPMAHDNHTGTWSFGDGSDTRQQTMDTLIAPDFQLPDLHGCLHRLSDWFGQRVLLVTWASWCGCRDDLAIWESLQQELQDQPFQILAVALESRGADGARAWIDKASPSYPCLIDVEHRIAPLYNFTNVPQAVWINARGQIVRPAESAGVTDAFRRLDRSTGTLPDEARRELAAARSHYLDAVRDWARRGDSSEFVLNEAVARDRQQAPDAALEQAHVHFRLGRYLFAQGHRRQGRAFLHQAMALHPDSWAIWRQCQDLEEVGRSMGDSFWARVDALGDQPYYPPARL